MAKRYFRPDNYSIIEFPDGTDSYAKVGLRIYLGNEGFPVGPSVGGPIWSLEEMSGPGGITGCVEITEAEAVAIKAGARLAVGWQPIETAPKDGTPVLVENKGLVTVARWNDGRGLFELVDGVDSCGDPSVYPDPTHWHPLPPPRVK